MIDKPILSIDWDQRTLRMVHGSTGKRTVRIDEVLSVAIPKDVSREDPASMGSFIRQALSAAGIRTKRALVDIPREQANFYTLSLPNASDSDLASMVAFQIPKEMPYPVDQAVVDFARRESEASADTCEVLVAAVRLERMEYFKAVFEAAGLKLLRIGLRPNANEFAVNKLLQATPHARVLFVDVGPVTTEIDVFHNGQLVFSRAASVSIPDNLLNQSDSSELKIGDSASGEAAGLSVTTSPSANLLQETVRELMIEVTRSFEAYRVSASGVTLDHAVVGGSCDIEEALAEAIQKQYRISAQPYNPAHSFGWDADRGAAAGAFAATIGLVLGQLEPVHRKFDFLHPKRTVTAAERRIRKAPVAASIAILFTAAGGVFYFNFIKPQYDTRAQLREQIRLVEGQLADHERFGEVVRTLENYESQRIVWLDQLHDIISQLPDEKQIVLSSVDMKQKDHVIKFPYRANDSQVGGALISTLDSIKAPSGNRSQFKATLGATSLKQGDKYPYEGLVAVEIVDRDWKDE